MKSGVLVANFTIRKHTYVPISRTHAHTHTRILLHTYTSTHCSLAHAIIQLLAANTLPLASLIYCCYCVEFPISAPVAGTYSILWHFHSTNTVVPKSPRRLRYSIDLWLLLLLLLFCILIHTHTLPQRTISISLHRFTVRTVRTFYYFQYSIYYLLPLLCCCSSTCNKWGTQTLVVPQANAIKTQRANRHTLLSTAIYIRVCIYMHLYSYVFVCMFVRTHVCFRLCTCVYFTVRQSHCYCWHYRHAFNRTAYKSRPTPFTARRQITPVPR